MNLPQKIYTEQDVTRARASAKLVGWLQGGGVVLGGALVLKLLGWIPVVLGLGVVGWVMYKLFAGGKPDESP